MKMHNRLPLVGTEYAAGEVIRINGERFVVKNSYIGPCPVDDRYIWYVMPENANKGYNTIIHDICYENPPLPEDLFVI